MLSTPWWIGVCSKRSEQAMPAPIFEQLPEHPRLNHDGAIRAVRAHRPAASRHAILGAVRSRGALVRALVHAGHGRARRRRRLREQDDERRRRRFRRRDGRLPHDGAVFAAVHAARAHGHHGDGQPAAPHLELLQPARHGQLRAQRAARGPGVHARGSHAREPRPPSSFVPARAAIGASRAAR